MRALLSLQEQILTRLLITLATAMGITLWACAAAAEQVVDVYRAEVLVASQAVGERNTAARTALRDVMVRVSGDMTVPNQPEIRTAINQAQIYLQEFSYASTDERLERDGKLLPARLLILKFSPQSIERLLRDARLSIWPASRPKLLVWSIFRDTAGALHRVPDEPITQALYQQATLRGLPLTLPQQDFEDNIALPSDSLWNIDEVVIKQASERYKPDAILIGRYSQDSNGQWQGSWQLLHSSGNTPFEDRAGDAPTLFVRALNTVTDNFARLYAIVPRESGPDVIVLRIEGVSDFAAYKNLQRYLAGLAMVKRMELLQAEGAQQLVRLHIDGDQTLLLSTLELGKKLFPLNVETVPTLMVAPVLDPMDVLSTGLPPPLPPQTPGSFGNPLVYRWQP
jgi:hypothetical protein